MTKRERVLEAAEYRCHYCKCLLDVSTSHVHNSACVVGHIPPKLKGGSSESNLVACCRLCSQIKRDFDVTKYSLAAFRKWMNKRRFDLGYLSNTEWRLSDADEVVEVGGHAPSKDEIARDMTLSAPPEPGEVECLTKEQEEHDRAEAKRLHEKYFKPSAAQTLAASSLPSSTPTIEEQIKYLEESGKLAREASAKQDEEYRRINEERRKGNADAKVGVKSKTIDDLIDTDD